MNIISLETTLEPGRAKRLRAATHAAHERLDKRIMRSAPFADRGQYGLFLQVQYLFHREIDALYRDGTSSHCCRISRRAAGSFDRTGL